MPVEETVSAKLPTKKGDFRIHGFRINGKTHLALTKHLEKKEVPLVRIHSKCITGDALFSKRCDCGDQLSKAMDIISEEGGVLIYLNQEGRGIGLFNKIEAYSLQDKGRDTVEANQDLGFEPDERSYTPATEIMESFGLEKIKLLTNNPEKVEKVEEAGFQVERVGLQTEVYRENRGYLETKKDKFGHSLDV